MVPDIPCLFVSGYVLDENQADFITDERLDLLWKPYKKHELLAKVREVIDISPRRTTR